MPDQEAIEQQQALLSTYRRNLMHLLRQAAQFGGESFTPPHVANGIYEARENIQRIKEVLRAWGVDVADYPNDGEYHIPVKSTSPQNSGERNQIFISYSRADKKWLDRLMIHLRPLVRDDNLKVWNDTMIAPGSKWKEEIDQALQSTKVALLLVSADFLASDFIAHNELPPLLKAAEEAGATILPLILSHSRFLQTESLSRYQAVNPPSQPLASLPRARQEELLVKVTVTIETTLRVPPESNIGEITETKETVNPNSTIDMTSADVAIPKTSKKLTGWQLAKLDAALLNAFDLHSLARLVRFELDEKLTTIVPTASSMSETVFALLEWAESQGRTKELIIAARKANPGNIELRDAAREIYGADA
jgi:hypothetical protein